jgi:hypothetical protein
MVSKEATIASFGRKVPFSCEERDILFLTSFSVSKMLAFYHPMALAILSGGIAGH